MHRYLVRFRQVTSTAYSDAIYGCNCGGLSVRKVILICKRENNLRRFPIRSILEPDHPNATIVFAASE